MLFGLFRRKTLKSEHDAYCAIVAQARQTEFYRAYGVEDTIDGRFDMIVLHAVLLFDRLRGEGKGPSGFAQNVFDLFFQDMDASLRELGVTDTRVPKKIKVMGEAFYGRADAYCPALAEKDEAALAEALGRNVFPDEENPAGALPLARYMIAAAEALKTQETQNLMAGKTTFPAPDAFVEQRN